MNHYEVLKKYFGYDQFREGQETLINSILSGKDTLGIMPTGAGKSLCFQVPAYMMGGITLVVSPLISLMKDQVESLNQAGLLAAYFNSSLSSVQYYKALEYAKAGRYPVIYVAPERLLTSEFLDFALHTHISMVTVDESHCVSQWGQDFRPSYLKIAEFIKILPTRPVISAFTATATGEVRDDIIKILMMDNPTIVTTGFDRPNLYYEVKNVKNKYESIRQFLNRHQGDSGIIYCLTRKNVEEVWNHLIMDGYLVAKYHAGLKDEERKKNQDDFIYDRSPIMVATNAFGMGIDKSNVRYVIHYNMPKNMESYYQEAGRAGRDQEPAECLLYYSGQDVVTNQYFIDNNRDNTELDESIRDYVIGRDRERLRKMTYYCFTRECLRSYTLKYFGETKIPKCGNCSNCMGKFEMVDITQETNVILSCINEGNERYGGAVILETVRGADTIKIRQYRMNMNSYYGKLKKISVTRLKQILNYLLVNDYLDVTNDGYNILKLNEKSMYFMDTNQQLSMEEEIKEPEYEGTKSNVKIRKSGKAMLSEMDQQLFEKLRNLRTQIAKEEQVPPYLVFSDKTLVHMCQLKPLDQSQMMEVTGVGVFKYEKYGESFLLAIRN